MQKLTLKTKFADMAGVNPSTVTRLCSTKLKDAVVNGKIDLAHASVIKYLDERNRDKTTPDGLELDSRYKEVLTACKEEGRYSTTFIRKTFGFGDVRTKRITDMFKATGVGKDAPPPIAKPIGGAVVKQAKKERARERINETMEDQEFLTGSMVHEVPNDIQAFADMTLRELIQRFGTDSSFVDWLKATQIIEAINEKRLKNAQTQGNLVSRELVKIGVIEPLDAVHIKLLTDGSKTITRRVTAMHDSGRGLDEIEAFVKDQITSFIRPVKAKVARALKNA